MSAQHTPGPLVGQHMRVTMTHLLQRVTFTAEIIKDDGAETVTARIPQRIRSLKWTEFPAAAYRFKRSAAIAAIAKATGSAA